jgi:adenosylmethionine-8-amino-7-oxononanoate aminotransferase
MEARRRGLLLRPIGNVIVLMPPLSITRRELERVTDITIESINHVT